MAASEQQQPQQRGAAAQAQNGSASIKPPSSAAAGKQCGSARDEHTQVMSRQQVITTGGWIAVWIVNSVSLIIVNKHVITFSGFTFPFTLALWHMLLASGSARAAVRLLRMPDALAEHASPHFYAQVGAIGALFAGTLVTGNAALQILSVPTVQMLKASGPASIYFIGIVLGNERLAGMTLLRVLVVCTGVGIASYGDVTLSAAGFSLQIVSILMDATRCCVLQRVLQANHIEAHPLVTLGHVAPFAAGALLLPAIAVEGGRLVRDYDTWATAVPAVLLSGVLATTLNFLVFKIIRLTSALSTSLAGVIKEWACILVAMQVYATPVTPLQWGGYSLAIAGLLWYQSSRLAAASQPATAGAGKAADADADAAPLLEKQRSLASPSDAALSPLRTVKAGSAEGGDVEAPPPPR